MLRISFNDLIGYEDESFPDRERRLVGSYPELLHSLLNDRLTKTQKCYIMLYYTENITMTEIAERYGVNRSTVSRTIKRARDRLRSAIGCEILKRHIRMKTEGSYDDPDH